MPDLFQRVCRHLGVEPGQILVYRIRRDDIVVVVDRGIAGCPKYIIPMSEIQSADTEIDATPAAQRQARMAGVDIEEVARSANYGRVTVYDVRNYVKAMKQSDG